MLSNYVRIWSDARLETRTEESFFLALWKFNILNIESRKKWTRKVVNYSWKGLS